MMCIYKGIVLNLILGLILTIQANPIASKQNDKDATTKASTSEGGLSKGIIAVIIGIGLTTFFVVVIVFYMVRGYRNQRSSDLAATQNSATDETPSDHTAAQSNLGLNMSAV